MTTEPMDETLSTLLDLSQQLLDSILAADWETYERLCDPTISAFEPEARGQLVEGLDFHRYYFELGSGDKPKQATIASPHIRLLGDNVAIISYVRLVQSIDSGGNPQSSRCDETRVWERQEDGWRHVHFHRSVNS
ncbi:MAG: nuclear transport factor 2 family protein [Planctomycetaceae bacterium]|nr:nuclear transport factor 2 family protein [Planctomycetales bacterium]MCB9923494.1 nuclear transport factor 2 family protein [Planctomycetaceae bacterium]